MTPVSKCTSAQCHLNGDSIMSIPYWRVLSAISDQATFLKICTVCGTMKMSCYPCLSRRFRSENTQNFHLTSKKCALPLKRPNSCPIPGLGRCPWSSPRSDFCSRYRICREPSFFGANTIGGVHSDRVASITFMRNILSISALLKLRAFHPSWYGAELTERTSGVVSLMRCFAISIGLNVSSTFLEILQACSKMCDEFQDTLHQYWRCLTSWYATHYRLQPWFTCVCPSELLMILFLVLYGWDGVCDRLIFLLTCFRGNGCGLIQMDNYLT